MRVVVLVTASGENEAEKITQKLLERRLAACINIVPCVQSRFVWKGKIERCKEALMIIKSKSEVFDELVKAIRALHSYQVPEILAVPVQSSYVEYLAWVDEVIKK